MSQESKKERTVVTTRIVCETEAAASQIYEEINALINYHMRIGNLKSTKLSKEVDTEIEMLAQ